MFLAFIHIVTGNSTSFVFSCLNTIPLYGYATLCLSIHQLGIWIVSSYWLPWIILRWSFLFSVTKLCQTLCDPMDCSMLGFPVLHYLPRFAQTHVHLVDDAIQPSHPLLVPFSSRLQPFPASGSFPVSRLFASDSQRIGASASASVLPMNIQDWFPLGWTGMISLQIKGLSRVFSNITVQKHQFFGCSAFFTVQLSHPYMTTGKTIALTSRIFVGKVRSLLLNMLSRLVITFLLRSKRLLISWLQWPSAVILEHKK